MSTQMDDEARERMSQTASPIEERSLADNVRIGVGVALLLALAAFFIQNSDETEISFLWLSRDLPLVAALILSAAVGGLATWLFTTLRGRSERKRQEAMFDSAMRGAKKDR